MLFHWKQFNFWLTQDSFMCDVFNKRVLFYLCCKEIVAICLGAILYQASTSNVSFYVLGSMWVGCIVDFKSDILLTSNVRSCLSRFNCLAKNMVNVLSELSKSASQNTAKEQVLWREIVLVIRRFQFVRLFCMISSLSKMIILL